MVDKHVIVVGAGPGGLTSAMLLASRGFKVTVLEKAPVVGGRNAAINLGDFKFDTGPTFLMMKFVLDDVFRAAGRKSEDYLKFKSLEPMYQLCYDDGAILSWSDNARMRAEIARSYPGEEQGYDRFRAYEPVRFNRLYAMLSRDYTNFSDLLRADVFRAIPHLSLGRSLFDVISSYFKDEKLKLAFTFGSKYLGMSPWDCPGGYMMIPFVEHEFGIYHVMGGLCEISEAMAKVVREQGGDIRLNAPVKKLIVEGRAVKGVELESGERIAADEVIVNADFAYAMTHLVDRGWLRSYTPERLAKKNYSCSTFMLYLGLDKVYDLPHHNIVFAKDYRANVTDIFKNFRLSGDTSFYLQNPSVTDPSLAPPGKSAVYVLVPVSNNKSHIDWGKEKEAFKERVLDTLEQRTPMKDIRQHIEAIKVITPADWEGQYNVYLGATFNLSHELGQMLYFRPHNQFEELDSCYIVGGGTHPGSGLPTIYVSGQISANLICRKYGVTEAPVKRELATVPRPVAR
jgi:phytoene desaturase